LDVLVDAYRNTPSDHWGTPGDADAIGKPRQYREKVEQLIALIPEATQRDAPRILDIGCFHGDFLAAFPDHWDKHGVELSRGAASVARGRGISVHEGDVFSVDLPEGHFDLILACDVIEHLEEQHVFASLIRRWLKPGGIAVIETGGADSWLARVMGSRWYYLSIVEHVCAHTAESLDRLMEAQGLMPALRERRWHRLPPSWKQPAYRVARALAFRLGTAGLERLSSICALPPVARGLVERHSPWHATRDHLFHAYRLEV
jgi:SAM-dependent methyltransferase